jgi:hypothetical protein
MGGKQLGFSDYELTAAKNQTKREKFLAEMEGGRPAEWCKSRGAAPATPVLAAFSSEPLRGNGWAGL